MLEIKLERKGDRRNFNIDCYQFNLTGLNYSGCGQTLPAVTRISKPDYNNNLKVF